MGIFRKTAAILGDSSVHAHVSCAPFFFVFFWAKLTCPRPAIRLGRPVPVSYSGTRTTLGVGLPPLSRPSFRPGSTIPAKTLALAAASGWVQKSCPQLLFLHLLRRAAARRQFVPARMSFGQSFRIPAGGGFGPPLAGARSRDVSSRAGRNRRLAFVEELRQVLRACRLRVVEYAARAELSLLGSRPRRLCRELRPQTSRGRCR